MGGYLSVIGRVLYDFAPTLIIVIAAVYVLLVYWCNAVVHRDP